MKLNATAEMFPVDVARNSAASIRFAPLDQTEGYHELFRNLETALAEITGFHAVSPSAERWITGASMRGYSPSRRINASRGDVHRKVCLIPQSAHGTNPASAVMAGMKVVVTKTDARGNIDGRRPAREGRGAQG